MWEGKENTILFSFYCSVVRRSGEETVRKGKYETHYFFILYFLVTCRGAFVISLYIVKKSARGKK